MELGTVPCLDAPHPMRTEVILRPATGQRQARRRQRGAPRNDQIAGLPTRADFISNLKSSSKVWKRAMRAPPRCNGGLRPPHAHEFLAPPSCADRPINGWPLPTNAVHLHSFLDLIRTLLFSTCLRLANARLTIKLE